MTRTFPLILLLALGSLGVDAVAQVWFRRNPVTAPSPRSSCPPAYDYLRGRYVIFGGLSGNTHLDQTWEYDGAVWSMASPSVRPSPREGHMMFFDPVSTRIILFGGNNASTHWNDTWAWDGATWTALPQPVSPAPRSLAAVGFFPPTNTTYMLGGQVGSSTFLQDFWQWTGTQWQPIAPATPIGPRSQAKMDFDPVRGQLLLVSGHSSPPNVFHTDTWAFDGTAWTQLSVGTYGNPSSSAPMAFVASRGTCVLFSNEAPIIFGKTWELTAGGWQQVFPPESPRSRIRGYMVANLVRRTAMMFGGYDGVDLGDTWTIGESNPPTTQAIGSGCSSGSGTPALGALGLPWQGESFDVTLSGLPPTPLNVPLLLAGSPAPAPISLATIGAPGCLLYLDPSPGLASVIGTNTGGMASWTVLVPPGLAGAGFDFQALVLAPGANPLGIAFSNALVGVVR